MHDSRVDLAHRMAVILRPWRHRADDDDFPVPRFPDVDFSVIRKMPVTSGYLERRHVQLARSTRNRFPVCRF